jgi:hypothetical protein
LPKQLPIASFALLLNTDIVSVQGESLERFE